MAADNRAKYVLRVVAQKSTGYTLSAELSKRILR